MTTSDSHNGSDSQCRLSDQVLANTDDRFDYPEVRFVTVGFLTNRMVVLVWTPDPDSMNEECRRIISMRKANVREQTRYSQQLGEAGRNH
jgi:uncharacterized DUF497 family protein